MSAYYTINLKVDTAFARQVDAALRAALRAAARAALKHQQAAGPAALSLLISGDATLHELNCEFLGEDRPTDVLSFPASEVDIDSGVRYLGDIAISLPTARAQAKAARHPLKAEMQLLVVHGVLHLLGHDHARAREKARMWQAQSAVLAELAATRK